MPGGGGELGGGDGGDGGAGGDGGGEGDAGGAGATQPLVSELKPLCSSLLAVLAGRPETLPKVERQERAAVTWEGVKLFLSARIWEATPATCGHAIDVPEMVLTSVSEPVQAAVMLEPGAWMSTHGPLLLNPLFASVLVVEPTVMALGVDAGE